jgi:phosphatidylserine/phosphatidylglycerophosphate/cardiolipin synthase-like enzyme
MKKIIIVLSLILLSACPGYAKKFKCSGDVSVFSSPRGGCTQAIVEHIDNSKTSIECQAYSFTSAPIADAMIRAYERGVSVVVIVDKGQKSQKSSMYHRLLAKGVPVYVDSMHAIAHNKIIIIDGASVFTGSFNFTGNAENNNAENLVIFEGNAPIADYYLELFLEHQKHSVQSEKVRH